jgi:enoyl-CoA hydratase/carnithine racemase
MTEGIQRQRQLTASISDLVIATPNAKFALPEALRGIWAGAGGLPRLIRTCGLQVASEIAMTGRHISVEEAVRYCLVNKVVKSHGVLVAEAITLANNLANISPDAMIVTKAALRDAWETASVDTSADIINRKYEEALMQGENAREGLAAFAMKRAPVWRPSKL